MKTRLDKKTVLYTHPVFIIGSYDKDDTPNIMAVSWGGICCSSPPCLAISLREATYTYHNIMDKMAFTASIPSSKFVKQSDYVGIYSGRDENKFKSTGLTPLKSEFVDAPYIDEFPMVLHCKVIKTVKIGLHTQFIGEIIEITADENVLNEKGQPDISLINPFIYDNASRAYFAVGDKISDAYANTKQVIIHE